MTETIYTRALSQAVEMLGGTNGLADMLHVPETTLAKWISGRAQMPLLAFHRTIEFLREHDRAAPEPTPGPAVERVVFTVGGVCARCAHCGGTEFLSTVPLNALRISSRLQCMSCKLDAAHGDVIAALAILAVRQPRQVRNPARRTVIG